MRKIRIMASRQAWMEFRMFGAMASRCRYDRIVAYECVRNGTDTYTPYWMA